jgi:hypothetical protein
MAYALYATAAVHRNDLDAARPAADWLVANAQNGGWGLRHACPAFESVNPPETVYGIETALAVRALLDVHGATSEKAYADSALAALGNYARFFIRSAEGGFFAYSDQPSDARQVSNVSAMLAGQYARGGGPCSDGPTSPNSPARWSRSFSASARSTVTGAHYWPIIGKGSESNDSLHAAYVVSGSSNTAVTRPNRSRRSIRS